MAPKKKKRKEKGTYKQFENLSLQQVLDKVEDSLSSENPRDALYTLKFAMKKFGETEDIRALFFQSYLLREKQLREKDLHAEADAVRDLANKYVPGFDRIPEETLIDYVGTAADANAVNAYVEYSASKGRSPRVERALVHRFFKGGDWKALERLEESNPLRQDAGPAGKAVSLMNQGAWEDALDALGSISRTSPYASIRVFCRAMVCFIKGDDKTAARALEMIPEGFPLSGIVRRMKAIVDEATSFDERSLAMEELSFLWDGPVTMERDIRLLIQSIDQERFKQAREFIQVIAHNFNPSDPLGTTTFIMECLWKFSAMDRLDDYDFQKMATALLPKEKVDPLFLKIRLIMSVKPFSSLGLYISELGKEFSDPEERKIAHALILWQTANFIHRRDGRMQFKAEQRFIEKYRDQLGIRSDNYESALLDMAGFSLQIDPGNRNAYEFIAALPRNSREDKKKVESALNAMLKEFPDDPFPCLELASLFYESNAFRKAENILEEALKRAPHDARVLDLHVLSLLISSDINIRREKYHLVERDLERAASFESKKLEPFIFEKKLLYNLKSSSDELAPEDPGLIRQLSLFGKRRTPSSFLMEKLAERSAYERLKILSILMLDLKEKNLPQEASILKGVNAMIDKDLKKEIKNLSSSQIVQLLTPFGKEFRPLLGDLKPAPVFIRRAVPMLASVDTADVFQLYDLILEPQLYPAIIKDIRSRVKKASEKECRMLNFFRVAIEHISGKKDDPELFYNIVDDLEEGQSLEELRALSRRLSKHASGPLKMALDEFDFELLEKKFGFPGMPFDFDLDDLLPKLANIFGDGEDDDDDNLDDERFFEMLEMLSKIGVAESEEFEEELDILIDEAEEWVVSLELTGLPTHLIKEMRNMLFKMEPDAKKELTMIARVCEQTGAIDGLSREAHVLLYGKARKK